MAARQKIRFYLFVPVVLNFFAIDAEGSCYVVIHDTPSGEISGIINNSYTLMRQVVLTAHEE